MDRPKWTTLSVTRAPWQRMSLLATKGIRPLGPLGPLGSSSSQHRRTLELILQEGSAFFLSIKPKVRKDRPLQKELISNRLKDCPQSGTGAAIDRLQT